MPLQHRVRWELSLGYFCPGSRKSTPCLLSRPGSHLATWWETFSVGSPRSIYTGNGSFGSWQLWRHVRADFHCSSCPRLRRMCGIAVVASRKAPQSPHLGDGLDWTALFHGILDVVVSSSNRGERGGVDVAMGTDAAGRIMYSVPSLVCLLGTSIGKTTRFADPTDETERLQVQDILRCTSHCIHILGSLQQLPRFRDLFLPGLSKT